MAKNIDELMSEYARSQVAGKQYGAAGRQDLAQGADKYRNQVLQQLSGQGVSIKPDVDMSQRYTKEYGNQFAGSYDPNKQGMTPIQQMAQKQGQQPHTMENTFKVMVDENGRRYIPKLAALQFVEGLNQQGRAEKESKKQYNDKMALGFSERYGVPINPMDSIQNLFAQVKGMKPLDVMRDERNYNRDVFTSDRDYNRDVFDTDRKYDRDVFASDRDFEEKGKVFLQEEVSGLREAVLTGGLSADQALAQIQDDMKNGLYTPEQAQVLQGIASGMKTYGDKKNRDQIDLTMSNITPKTHSAEEAKAAVEKLGILSPGEQLKMNQEIDAKWKQDQSSDPGVMDRLKGALSGGTWQNTVGAAAVAGLSLKALFDLVTGRSPKDQP